MGFIHLPNHSLRACLVMTSTRPLSVLRSSKACITPRFVNTFERPLLADSGLSRLVEVGHKRSFTVGKIGANHAVGWKIAGWIYVLARKID